MNRRVVQYFSGELGGEERKALLREAIEDKDLLDEMVSARHVQTLLDLQRAESDAEQGKASYAQFELRYRRAQLRRLAMMAVRYAAVLVIGAIGAWWWMHPGEPQVLIEPDSVAQTLTVPAGQRAHITLPDGSRVWVNAGSRLSYPSQFGNERRVRIEGEALFDVAKGGKPFIVSAGNMEIRALGTQFNVYGYAGEPLTVSLIEGRVKVYDPSVESKSVTLKAGESAIERDGELVVEANGDNILTWRDGVYSFDNVPMSAILHKLEVYYDVHFVVSDQELLDTEFTGKFRQRDGVMEVLRILQMIHPFGVIHEPGSKEITITPAE
ncbi:MAG: FecR family protein [Muribaculaceae bacterium]